MGTSEVGVRSRVKTISQSLKRKLLFENPGPPIENLIIYTAIHNSLIEDPPSNTAGSSSSRPS